MTQGVRKYPDEDGELWLSIGEYGQGADGRWYARPPDAWTGDLRNHDVTEHDDGTITVSPSIRILGGDGEGVGRELWHGYLEKGVWRSV